LLEARVSKGLPWRIRAEPASLAGRHGTDRDAENGPAQVRSSLARRLGMDTGGLVTVGRGAEAIATVVLDATQRFDAALTAERLFGWHAALFAQGGGGRPPITVGAWRDDALGAMQVVSGWPGRERVHFVAPAAARVAGEMAAFLAWFEGGAEVDPVPRAAVAPPWFVTVHPFDDGNGRIGRAIAERALARSEGTGQRYSLSERLLRERGAYYAALEAAQGGGVDVTAWVAWFLGVFDRALGDAEAVPGATLRRARVWEGLAGEAVNARQRGDAGAAAGRRGAADDVEVGTDRGVLAGYGAAGYRGAGAAGGAGEGGGWRMEHGVWVKLLKNTLV